MNLGELENMAKYDQEVKLLFNRINISSYDDFVSCVNADLDHCVVMLQDKAKYLQPGKNGEDQVSATLALILEGMLYSVSSCFMKGGNTDLTIKARNFSYTWIGEAKLVTGVNNPHLWGGFEQLTTRYTSGDFNNGGLLVYIFSKDALGIMESFKAYTEQKNDYNFKYKNCQTRKAGGFYTTHVHAASGLDFKTRYIPVILNHEPLK